MYKCAPHQGMLAHSNSCVDTVMMKQVKSPTQRKFKIITPQAAGQLLLHVAVTQQPLVHVHSEMHTSEDCYSIHSARQL